MQIVFRGLKKSQKSINKEYLKVKDSSFNEESLTFSRF